MTDTLPGTIEATPDDGDALIELDPVDAPVRDPRRVGAMAVRLGDRLTDVTMETWVTALVVVGCSVMTLLQLSPGNLVSTTTPTGGDFGAHVWAPAYLRDHILANWRLSGWSPDWYGGFPLYRFYMVVPALAVVVVDVILPYTVALKLVSVLGIVTLAPAAATLARATGLRFPYPPLFALAATFFLFDETFTIYGGNIASTMAGEYSFSIALSLSLFALASFVHGLRTGQGRARTAALFALCALCHLIVCFFAIVGAAALLCLYLDRHRVRFVLPTAVVTALLVSFWMLPFYAGRNYMTDMGYERRPLRAPNKAPNGHVDSYWQMLFPQGLAVDRIIVGLAIIGVLGSVLRARRVGPWLAAMTVGYGLWACLWHQSHLWNARLLPFMYLSRYLLAAVGVGELYCVAGHVAGRVRRAQMARRLIPAALVVSAGLTAVVILGMGLRVLPGGSKVTATVNGKSVSQYRWGPFASNRAAFADDWARWNYKGYESKNAYGEYRGIVTTMAELGTSRGCGRALWEPNSNETRYGTTMALMLLPYWTDGCIASMEGLFFEASATTPFHFMAASALAKSPSNPVRGQPYSGLDVAKGARELQLLGVRYYMAFTPEAVTQADAVSSLRPVAASGPWRVYEVSDADLVVPLQFRPVVARGVGDRKAWLDLGTKFFQSPEMWDVNVAASGPANWERVKVVSTLEPGAKPGRVRGQVRLGTDPTKVALPAAIVSGIATDDDEVEFDVDQVGVPVLVKTSYFPGWHVEGADGPYRVAPNQMVVIPTSRHVRLHFDESGVEKLSYAMTLVGLVGLVGLHRAGPVVYPTPRRRRRSTDGRYLGDPGFGDGFAHARSGDDSGDDSGHDSGDGAWLFEWGDDRFQLQGLDSDEDPLSVAPLGDPLDPPRSPPVTSWDVGPPEQPAW